MSDHKKLDELMQSLNVPPNQEAKQKARELFLQTAEEVKQARNESNIKPSSIFQKNKRSLLSFAAGMAAMLILMVGVLTAYNPEFLTGSVTGTGDIVRYRIFPSEINAPVLDTSQKYLGELSVFHMPGEGEAVHSQFVKCDGRTLNLTGDEDNPALFSVLKDALGYDSNATEFRLPDYTARSVAAGFDYYMTRRGTKADMRGTQDAIIKDGLAYIPVKLSDYKVDYANAVCYGEIVLLKGTDKALRKSGYIPCEGQTLDASDYPMLAKMLAQGEECFTLPDLSGQSPVEGAVYCVANTGDYPYVGTAGR